MIGFPLNRVEIFVSKKNCGERYYDRRTIQSLEGLREKLEKKEFKLKEVVKIRELVS